MSDFAMMLKAKPSNFQRLAIIIVVSLKVFSCSANFTRARLYPSTPNSPHNRSSCILFFWIPCATILLILNPFGSALWSLIAKPLVGRILFAVFLIVLFYFFTTAYLARVIA